MLSAISGNVNTVFALILSKSELKLHSIEDTFGRMAWGTDSLQHSVDHPHLMRF